MNKPDVVVVGGGPAGSAAAIWLADAGARVVLVERQARAHHKVCGEFVSGEAGRHLRELGLDPALLGSVPVERIRLACGDRIGESPLPFRAESLSRFTLDEALLETASVRGVDVRRGLSARNCTVCPGGVRIDLSDGSTLEGRALFLATGKHVLRGYPRGRGVQDNLIGFKMHLETPAGVDRALAGSVEILLFQGGYAGLQPLGAGHANLCLLVTKAHYEALGRSWPDLLSHLSGSSGIWRERLAEARASWNRPLSIYGVPYGYVAGARSGPVFRLGDQIAVIPSFAGDGIAIALSTARSAAEAFISEGPTSLSYHQRATRSLGGGVRVAAWASRALQSPFLQSLAVRAGIRKPELLAMVAGATRLAA